MAGLDATGFTILTLEEVREEINTVLRSIFGQSIDVSDSSVLGQLAGIFAEREAILWELAEAVYSSRDPDNATGIALDALAALTGTLREDATPSVVTLTLTGDDATLVGAGSQAATASTGIVFDTDAAATITAHSAWAISTSYTIGDRVYNDTPDRVYECTVSGTSAGAGGPTGTSDVIVDGTVNWKYLGDGQGSVDVASAAIETGPQVAFARDITSIETPVSGWLGVINNLDADLGTNQETDEQLRARRVEELTAPGTSPFEAVRTALLALLDVTSVRLFFNNTDTTSVDGIPPHAVEALVLGGTDVDIFQALWDNIAVGILTHGNTAGTITDSQGTVQPVEFSRPTEIDIYVDITVEYDSTLYPANGDDQIKAAIVAYGDAQEGGTDVRASAVSQAAFDVAGVLGVTAIATGTAPAPVGSADIVVDLRELAKYDTSRITVTSSAVTP